MAAVPILLRPTCPMPVHHNLMNSMAPLAEVPVHSNNISASGGSPESSSTSLSTLPTLHNSGNSVAPHAEVSMHSNKVPSSDEAILNLIDAESVAPHADEHRPYKVSTLGCSTKYTSTSSPSKPMRHKSKNSMAPHAEVPMHTNKESSSVPDALAPLAEVPIHTNKVSSSLPVPGNNEVTEDSIPTISDAESVAPLVDEHKAPCVQLSKSALGVEYMADRHDDPLEFQLQEFNRILRCNIIS